MTTKPLRRKSNPFLIQFVVGFILLILLVVITIGLTRNLGLPIRLFNDYFDRGVYYVRASWYTEGKVPYRDTICEYPQIALYFLTIPFFLSPDKTVSQGQYVVLITAFMLLCLYGIFLLLYGMLEEKNKLAAFLLFLPASLYFTLNRFDILPAFITLLSLWFLKKKKMGLASIFLAIAVFTKWYAAVLFPIYLDYAFWEQRKKISCRMIVYFGVTSILIILPTFITGGMEAVIAPYRFHSVRGVENHGILPMIAFFSRGVFDPNLGSVGLVTLFFLQFASILLIITSRIDSFRKALQWSVVAILVFLLFAKFYSPQWLLWLTPLLILLVRDWKDAVWIVALDLFTYLMFPIGYDLNLKSMPLEIFYIPVFVIYCRYLLVNLIELLPDNLLILRLKQVNV
jgi:Gpi18-like mannosyltransferase